MLQVCGLNKDDCCCVRHTELFGTSLPFSWFIPWACNDSEKKVKEGKGRNGGRERRREMEGGKSLKNILENQHLIFEDQSAFGVMGKF